MKHGKFLTAIFWASCLWVHGARAQPASQTGMRPLLPRVPGTQPRPLESDQERFPHEPRGPVAGLLESATTSDAVLEVIVGHGRILTTKAPIAREGGPALIGVGDPTVLGLQPEGPRLIRLLGNRVGVTDLSITTNEGETYTFEVHVVYDLELLHAYLQQIFPDALIELQQLREHIVLKGQARSTQQVSQIVQTLQSFLYSAQVSRQISGGTSQSPGRPSERGPREEEPPPEEDAEQEEPPAGPAPITVPEDRPNVRGEFAPGQIINLMRVPGVQQVMLKVQVAELNRTAMRQIGADILYRDGVTTLGTAIAGAANGVGLLGLGTSTTAFGIFDSGKLSIFLNALRTNSIANILAEPNLVAMDGQEASFLAGGEFPVPVPQTSGGVNNAITIQFKEFGVLLNFVPTILDDETIRLRVAPEVSDIDESTAVFIQGFFVPGLRSRRVSTTVELKQGQTLALAGLLQVELDANTARIPGLGDLPYIGPMFSNTSHERVEKELLVMVTPQLISPMEHHQVPPAPGSEVLDPNDLEFYLLNRIEGRTGRPFRPTTAWDDPQVHLLHLERQYVSGPVGYSQ